jgi:hypothetical protein
LFVATLPIKQNVRPILIMPVNSVAPVNSEGGMISGDQRTSESEDIMNASNQPNLYSSRPNLYLSKSLYTTGVQCPKALWLQKYRPEVSDDFSAEVEVILEAGKDVGMYAQELFPGGVLVPYEELSLSEQLSLTRESIAKGAATIYEATFSHDQILVKADILHSGAEGWELYEVKSTTKEKENFLDDIAIQYYVLTGAGLHVAKACLVHLNREYVRQGPIEAGKLFTTVDLTEEIRSMQPDVIARLAAMRAMLQADMPDIDIGPQCSTPYTCRFHGHCWAHIPENSVFDFRGQGRPNGFDLYRNGTVKMEDVPHKILGWRQKLQLDGILHQKNHFDKKAVKEFLDSLWYPLCFMDFETTYMVPLPLFDGMRPYEQLPFQYSLHVIEKEGREPVHYEYLAKEMKNPCEEFLANLLAVIPAGACILVWNQAFEKRILRELAGKFPGRKDEIDAVVENIRDLMIPFRDKSIYHWKFGGSYSIKNVLPALVEGYSYEDMAISNGGMASGAWVGMVKEIDMEIRGRVYMELFEYCHLDTMAMVRILESIKSVHEI